MVTADMPALRRRLGRVGVWTSKVGDVAADVERAAVREIEDLGFGALWFGESSQNKEAFVHAAILLQATSTLMVATGIASIYGRDASAARFASDTLGEAFDGRFVLGLGVSHPPLVASRGHDYGRPLTAMREYLQAMDAAQYLPPPPSSPVPTVLAALRPRMLELSRDRADGAHPYFAPVAHTRAARSILGPDPLLAPELMVILETDEVRARAIARKTAAGYLTMPNYVAHLRDLGYADEDLARDGSDRLIDEIIAWGTPGAIRDRVEAHLDSGADHVNIQPLAPDLAGQLEQLRVLAPVLLGA